MQAGPIPAIPYCFAPEIDLVWAAACAGHFPPKQATKTKRYQIGSVLRSQGKGRRPKTL